MKLSTRWLLILALAAGMSACTDDNDEEAAPVVVTPPPVVITTTQIVGITDDLRMFTFFPEAPATNSPVTITGYTVDSPSSPPRPVAFDLRPSSNELFMLMNDNRLYTVSNTTGVATLKGRITPASGVILLSMAFDPVTNVLRVIGTGGANYRISPVNAALISNDTALAYAAGDANAGTAQGVSALAYTGDGSGGITTAVAIDTVNDRLVRIGSINGSPDSASTGKLNTIAALSTPVSGNSGFDVEFGTNVRGYTIDTDATSTRVYRVNLFTGAMTSLGTIAGARLIGLSVVPGTGNTGSGPTTPPVTPPSIIVGEGGCAAAFATGSTVTKDETDPLCPVCSIEDEANLVDGDVTKAATAKLTLGLLLGQVSVTVKAPAGTTPFAAGRVAGGSFAIPGPLPLAVSLLPNITVSTELAGVEAESFAPANSLAYLSVFGQELITGEDRFFLGYTTTKPFDAVKLSIGVGVIGLLPNVDIYAACVNGVPNNEIPPGLIPL